VRSNNSNMSSPTRARVSHANADKNQGELDLDIGREAGTAALGGGKENAGKSRIKGIATAYSRWGLCRGDIS